MKWVIILGLTVAAIIFVILWSVAGTIANADDSKIVIQDVNGRTVTSTRTLETGTLVLRDAYGRNVGFATKNQDGSYTIKTPYGKKVGTVKEQD